MAVVSFELEACAAVFLFFAGALGLRGAGFEGATVTGTNVVVAAGGG